MNEQTIVNFIGIAIAIVVFAVRMLRKAAVAPPTANAAGASPVVPNVTAPTAAALQRPPPRVPFAPAAPAPALPAGEAFPVLDLTLPGGGRVTVPAPGRRRGRSMLGTGVPGSAAWGAGAIVAMEILGPPVSLRSGATLGAPHAF